MTAPEIHTTEPRGALALEKRREEVTQALMTRPAYDIAALDDDEFKQLLELDRKREERLAQIVKNRMVEGEDYGRVPGVEKPFAWEGAADKIIKFYRWDARLVGDPFVQRADSELSATVTVAVHDSMGRQVGPSTPRSCSTSERRFRKRSGTGRKYDDPRECLNECIAMAAKRAKVAATLSAAGAKKLFASDELHEDDGPPAPWTDDEKRAVLKMGRDVGLKTRAALARWIREYLHGREFPYTGQETAQLLETLKAYRPPPATIKDPQETYGQPAAAPATGPTAADLSGKPDALEDEDDELPF